MDDPMTLKRPKAKENEDDLLRMQEEFLQSNTKPSVNISSDQSSNQNKCSKRTSKFALSKKLKTNSKDDPNLEISPSTFILGNIVERNASDQFYPIFKNEASSSKTGFPSIFISEESKGNKEGSLFMQALSKEGKINKPSKEGKIDVKFEDYGLMTEEDILREKRKLESTLNPSLIEFIKRRKREKERSDDSRIKKEVKFQSLTESKREEIPEKSSNESKSEELPEMMEEIFTEAKRNNWVHMDVVEKEKTKWMEEVKKSEEIDRNEPYNARFDFNGILLPFNDDSITIDKGLHHHGDEPERPGYSLQELLQLTRSSSLQQRSIALQTLANIIEKSRRGWYDSVLHPAPLSALNEKNLLLLLRFSIDDSSTPVVTSALQALRNFLYNEEDEVCLDRYFGLDDFSEPILKPELEKDLDLAALKDHELARLDTVATCFRSDLVPRIRYILSDMHPPPIGVSSCLEILIRLCRHSVEMALNILGVENLLEVISRNFVPLTSRKLIDRENVTDAYGVPIISALRFFRILVTYAGRPAVEKLCRLNLVGSIISYLGCEAGSSGTFLYIECLRLWKLILLHGFTHDALSGSRIILQSQEKICFEKLNIGEASELFCEHAAALLSVVSHEDSFRSDILLSLKKWSTQLSSATSPTWGNMKLILQVLLAFEEFSEGSFQFKWLLNSKIFESLNSTSNLLSGLTNAKERSPSSLPSLGALTENGQLQPILSQSSSFSFLSQALQFFTKFSHRTEIELFFTQGDFIKYITSLSTSEWSLENSWFTRLEFNFLTNVIKAAKVFPEISEKMKNTLWILSMKLISALPGDFSSQTREILHFMLDPKKMSVQEILSNLQDLNIANENQICVNLSVELITIYESYIPVKGNWGQTALPKDWIFLPLIDTYRNLKISHQVEKKDKEKIMFVLNLYLGLPELVENLTPNLQFSRLILVFLCGTVFNEKNISPLIESVMSTFFRKHNKKLNLTKDVPGLSSFTDMFTALCENFFSHSYGNNYFTLVLLTFISQRQDVHYRKMLWSEHAGTLRYIKITIDKLLCSIDEFLYPIETDVSLINCYISSLLWGTVKKEWCSLPYIIALHHSGMFLKNSNQLALQMKSRLEKLERSEIIDEILNYDPSRIENSKNQ
ncbi:RNA polymerase II-associated protein 1 [Leptopilina heterotoma]|uniref:RNA polymerase II-associated protein 1 n=1 Tax=Leptopilina heterotoma TaxID=63436 RepID=UPI001CA7B9A7|nr:RNA polymerase II-associated protein 1 [Leptopilina heterotoma]